MEAALPRSSALALSYGIACMWKRSRKDQNPTHQVLSVRNSQRSFNRKDFLKTEMWNPKIYKDEIKDFCSTHKWEALAQCFPCRKAPGTLGFHDAQFPSNSHLCLSICRHPYSNSPWSHSGKFATLHSISLPHYFLWTLCSSMSSHKEQPCTGGYAFLSISFQYGQFPSPHPPNLLLKFLPRGEI